jgi:hypothetical protein
MGRMGGRRAYEKKGTHVSSSPQGPVLPLCRIYPFLQDFRSACITFAGRKILQDFRIFCRISGNFLGFFEYLVIIVLIE